MNCNKNAHTCIKAYIVIRLAPVEGALPVPSPVCDSEVEGG